MRENPTQKELVCGNCGHRTDASNFEGFSELPEPITCPKCCEKSFDFETTKAGLRVKKTA